MSDIRREVDDHEVLRRVMTEWVAACEPSMREFARVDRALEHFQKLLEQEALRPASGDAPEAAE